MNQLMAQILQKVKKKHNKTKQKNRPLMYVLQ